MLQEQYLANSRTYNRLPGVERAYRILAGNPSFELIMNEIGLTLARNNLEDIIGIYLIHRHNSIMDNEIMVQRANDHDDGSVRFVTSKERIEDISEFLIPVAWQCVSNGEIEPLEYGLHSELGLPFYFFSENKGVFAEVGSILTENCCQDVLGLTILDQPLLAAVGEGYIGTERTDTIRCANIVSLSPRSENIDAITTSWYFDGTSLQRCIPFKQCVQRSPGHDITPGHEFIDE
jgi:hypothetical protein